MTEQMDYTPHPGSRRDATAQAAIAETSDASDYAAPLSAEQFYVRTMERAAIYGGYSTWVFAGTETTAYRVLARDDSRARAYVTCSGTGPIYVAGSKDALVTVRNNGLPTSGPAFGIIVLAAGVVIPVSHQEALYVMPDGTHSATVSVAAERWATTPVT
jgi:hypothetical protein